MHSILVHVVKAERDYCFNFRVLDFDYGGLFQVLNFGLVLELFDWRRIVNVQTYGQGHREKKLTPK